MARRSKRSRRLRNYKIATVVVAVVAVGSVLSPDPSDPTGQPSPVDAVAPSPAVSAPPSASAPATAQLVKAPGAVVQDTVTQVVDGDTIDTATTGRVRLIGLNAPEKGECGYDWATTRLGQVVPPGSLVAIELGDVATVDKYGRTLGYVVSVSGVHAGLLLVQEGYAKEAYYGDNTKYRQAFLDAQASAKAQGIGDWTACQWLPTTTVPAPTPTAPAPTRAPAPTTPPRPTTTAAGAAYYANCSEARAAGAAPLYRSSPGYRTALDRDGDGVACE